MRGTSSLLFVACVALISGCSGGSKTKEGSAAANRAASSAATQDVAAEGAGDAQARAECRAQGTRQACASTAAKCAKARDDEACDALIGACKKGHEYGCRIVLRDRLCETNRGIACKVVTQFCIG